MTRLQVRFSRLSIPVAIFSLQNVHTCSAVHPFSGLKRPGREAKLYLYSGCMPLWHGQGKLYFYLYPLTV